MIHLKLVDVRNRSDYSIREEALLSPDANQLLRGFLFNEGVT